MGWFSLIVLILAFCRMLMISLIHALSHQLDRHINCLQCYKIIRSDLTDFHINSTAPISTKVKPRILIPICFLLTLLLLLFVLLVLLFVVLLLVVMTLMFHRGTNYFTLMQIHIIQKTNAVGLDAHDLCLPPQCLLA